MQDVDFFEGQRALTRVVFVLNGGKRTLACTPWEEWRLIEPCPFTLRCGNKREEKLTQRFGIEHSQRSSFESTIGSSLGSKGIAALESQLKAQIGDEIKLQYGTEHEQTFTFEAPECGYKVVRLYQRVRGLHLKYEDTRFWHRDAVELTLLHWLKQIYDATHAEPFDPSCRCEKAAPPPYAGQGLPARIVFGAAAKLAAFWPDEGGRLEFADRPGALERYFDWGERATQGHLSPRVVPDYLRHLAGIAEDELLAANAWADSTRYPATPSLAPQRDVTITLDDDFQPVEEIGSVLQVVAPDEALKVDLIEITPPSATLD